MSVKVENLTKIFGTQKAVNEASFTANKGEVLGFLGPNGAGKTTTMKIVTCYIPQTSGHVEVCGFDVRADAMEVRRKIGYLPEHNPLYKDMYVKEYLHFAAQVHKIKQPKKRIQEMIEMTGLGREEKKLIGTLSKGYRQRVGLAQAMLHNPEVLILDEPTSGLDPNQLVEIRNLIKRIAAEKTVIFSTHIMQEVQALCDRVVIINKGKIVANDPIERLKDRVRGDEIIHVEFQKQIDAATLNGIKGINKVKTLGNSRYELASSTDIDVRPLIFDYAVAHNLKIIELYKEVSTVEDVFQSLTK